MSGITRAIAVGLLSAAAILTPVAHAEPCDQTVGDSVDSYLKRHPDIKNDISKRGEKEDPGAPNPVLAYLERHPDVRQALITLSQQCV